MRNFLTPEADSVWMDQIFGLNYLTVSVLIGLLLIGILARFATMLMAPRVLKKIIPSESIQSKTVKDSDKALGTAAGAGLSLVSACDMAVAGKNVKFTSAYTAAGLTPDGSSTFHLPRSIGKKRTMELMLTNRVLSSKEALDWGLINSVVDDDQVLNETNKLAEKIANGPTMAFGGVKEMIRQTFSNGLETQMELESQIFSKQLKGKDAKEGIKAFTEKGKPSFKGE